jgi:dTMP kinase
MEAPVRGLFVTVEGGEGVGKSTQALQIARRFRSLGREVVETREPGGTPSGDRIRALLLDPDVRMSARTELFLYEASRAEVVAVVISPALQSGAVVVCDRFLDSTTAYQAYARGLDVEEVVALNHSATGGLRPDVTVLLTLELREALARATRHGADRMERESLEFHERVHDGFLEVAAAEPGRFLVVDAAGTPEQVTDAAWTALRRHAAVRAALGEA